jgi:DNA polymerase III subunit chi
MTAAEPTTAELKAAEPCDVMFYHLERAPVEKVLPQLLEKTLARGWRAVVQARDPRVLETLDEMLWTYSDVSFLPHGIDATSGTGKAKPGADTFASAQPVLLTTGNDTPNGARVRFLVDGAEPARYEGFARIVFLFDGNDTEAVSRARAQWKAAKAAGCGVTYWQQNDSGGWVKKA